MPASALPQPDTPNSLNRTLQLLRRAIRGEEQDFTRGSLRTGMIILAVPMVLELVMESVFAVVDIFFVGKLGAEAVATVGLTESVQTLVFALGIGLAMGTTAMVSRRIGENDIIEASRTGAQAILLGLLASIPFILIGQLAPETVLRLMGASPDVMATGSRYTGVLYSGNVFIILLFLINAIFRGAGNPVLAMRTLWLANGINILLDPCLIFGWGPFPALGVAGAAYATNIGRACGVAYQIWHLTRHENRVQITTRHLKPDFSLMRRLVRISAWGVIQFLLATSSWIFLMRVVAQFGSGVLAGYTIALRILSFTLLPSWGFANAAATLVGQNLGARQPQRAERATWLTARTNTIAMSLVGMALFLIPDTFVGLLTTDHDIALHATSCLRVLAVGYPCYAFGMVMIQAINGAGDTQRTTWINLTSFWLVEIPLAWILALPFGFGPMGAFMAIVIAETLFTLQSLILFRRGKWKLKEV